MVTIPGLTGIVNADGNVIDTEPAAVKVVAGVKTAVQVTDAALVTVELGVIDVTDVTVAAPARLAVPKRTLASTTMMAVALVMKRIGLKTDLVGGLTDDWTLRGISLLVL